jgi:peptidoglycan/LPS O-acetylase OafA/YrhL
LLGSVSPLLPLHPPLLAAAFVLALAGGWRAFRRGDARALALVVVVIGASAANAFATGALSKPHHRYQGRIAWLIPVAAVMTLAPPRRRHEDEAETRAASGG